MENIKTVSTKDNIQREIIKNLPTKEHKNIIINEEKILHSDQDSEENESDVEEIDLTDDPLYQILSTLFEDSDGNNLCDCIKELTKSVQYNSVLLQKVLTNQVSNNQVSNNQVSSNQVSSNHVSSNHVSS